MSIGVTLKDNERGKGFVVKDFDELRKVETDRRFKLDGYTFSFHEAVDQDLVDRYFDALLDAENTNASIQEVMDALILGCLVPEDREAWNIARHKEGNPVMAATMHDIVGYMIGVMTRRPTDRRTDSIGTPEVPGTTSTESSPQQAVSP